LTGLYTYQDESAKAIFTPLEEVVDIILDYFNVTLIGNIPV
jgi:hypothetical protein